MRWIKKMNKNPIWIFSLAIYATIELFVDIVKTFRMVFFSKIFSGLPIFEWSFLGNLLQIITVVVLYILYRSLINSKKQNSALNEHTIAEINKACDMVYQNLNHSHNILDKKIRYVDLRHEYPELDADAFIKKLHECGFSKEDLEDIGIEEKFIRQYGNKLLPRKLMEKYSDFQNELKNYKANNDQ